MTKPHPHSSIITELLKDRPRKKKFTKPMVIKSDKRLSDEQVDYYRGLANGKEYNPLVLLKP